MEDIKYISFRHTASNNVSALHLKNMINVKDYFKILKNTNILENARYENKQGSLREILLGIKNNKGQLFVGVE